MENKPRNSIKKTKDAGHLYRGKTNTLKARSQWSQAKGRQERQAQRMHKDLKQAHYKKNLPKGKAGVWGLMIQSAIDDITNRPVADGTLDAARKRGDLKRKK